MVCAPVNSLLLQQLTFSCNVPLHKCEMYEAPMYHMNKSICHTLPLSLSISSFLPPITHWQQPYSRGRHGCLTLIKGDTSISNYWYEKEDVLSLRSPILGNVHKCEQTYHKNKTKEKWKWHWNCQMFTLKTTFKWWPTWESFSLTIKSTLTYVEVTQEGANVKWMWWHEWMCVPYGMYNVITITERMTHVVSVDRHSIIFFFHHHRYKQKDKNNNSNNTTISKKMYVQKASTPELKPFAIDNVRCSQSWSVDEANRNKAIMEWNEWHNCTHCRY